MNKRHPFAPGVIVHCRPVTRPSPAVRAVLFVVLLASLAAAYQLWS